MENDLQRSKDGAKDVTEYIWEHLPKYRSLQGDLFSAENKINVLLSSQKQMIKVFKDFGIDVSTEDGESIEEGVIKKSKHPFVKLWLSYQKAEHSVTTFGQNILDQLKDGRLYTRYNPILDTGRISTRKGYINFLNFPSGKDTRLCFVPKTGYKAIVCDYSGQETVISADLSGDKEMLASVINGKCLHCAFARVIFPEIEHLTDDEIKEHHSVKRGYSKAPRFA
jgi:DNA polymerase I-like protein with 3'-5' exonuclease and polymerase domains